MFANESIGRSNRR
jgi:hypothetical protein